MDFSIYLVVMPEIQFKIADIRANYILLTHSDKDSPNVEVPTNQDSCTSGVGEISQCSHKEPSEQQADEGSEKQPADYWHILQISTDIVCL